MRIGSYENALAREQPVSFQDIRIELQSIMKWEQSTINTLIRCLVDKAVIMAYKQNVLYYTPNLSYSDYLQKEEQGIIDRLYSESGKNFVAALCKRGKLSEADIDELKDFFKMGDGGE